MRAQNELTTSEWLATIDAIADLGGQVIVMTGGEPLVRPDLPVLLHRAAHHGLWVEVETNGYRYPDLADELGGIDRLVVALEGEPTVHNLLREPGSFDQALAAVELARSRDTQVSTVTTLTSQNLDSWRYILDLAERMGFDASFRLVRDVPDLRPDPHALRRTLRAILDARRSGRPVGLGEKTLLGLLAWGDLDRPTTEYPASDQLCMAGQTHCLVDADGSVHACSQWVVAPKAGEVRAAGFAAAFEQLGDHACQACAVPELNDQNHLCNLNIPTILDTIDRHRQRGGHQQSVIVTSSDGKG